MIKDSNPRLPLHVLVQDQIIRPKNNNENIINRNWKQ